MPAPKIRSLTPFLSRLCKLTPLNSKTWHENLHKVLILIDRGGGGYPHRYQIVNIVRNRSFPRTICGYQCERANKRAAFDDFRSMVLTRAAPPELPRLGRWYTAFFL